MRLSNFTSTSEEYLQFASAKDACRQCSIYNSYKTVVQSEGNANNPIFMFIGESPGNQEAFNGRPFIGPAGQILRRELRKYPHIFNKNNCLFSNIISCRPKNNEFPLSESSHCFKVNLRKEISILKPKIIVTVGHHALYYLRYESGITGYHGSWKFMSQYPAWCFAIYHPSYVLRSIDTEKHYVLNEFEYDIKKLSRTYDQMCNDPRLLMSPTEWDNYKALDFAVQHKMVQVGEYSVDLNYDGYIF